MNNTDAYKEILSILEKHQELLKGDHQVDIAGKLKNRIKVQGLSDEFGINLLPDSNPTWCRLGAYAAIGLFGEEYSRTISWSDDDSQPNDERLYRICFPTGAYVFGKSYPTNTFKLFFEELRSYNPKYADSHNHCLYFTKDTAKAVHDDFKSVFDKHRDTVSAEVKMQKIESLKQELSRLEGVDK